jgi:hypothetical protein
VDAVTGGLMTGLRFGQWFAWGGSSSALGGERLYEAAFVHPVGRLAIRMPVVNGGWADFRTATGTWLTLFSDGIVRHDPASHWVDDILDRKPAADWPSSALTAGHWTFTPGPDRLILAHSGGRPPLVLHRDRPLWTREKKPPLEPED